MTDRALRVLILEDNPDHAELIVTALKTRDENFAISVCNKKSEFMEHLQRERFDAFLIDYNLPDTDGMEILEELTSLEYHTPVIFISGTENDEVITQVLHAGAADFIIKSRTSLKTLPIIVKRNIIRKMKREEQMPRGESWRAPLEEALSKVSAAISTSSIAADEIQRLDDLLDKTAKVIKAAKEKLPVRLPKLKTARRRKKSRASARSN